MKIKYMVSFNTNKNNNLSIKLNENKITSTLKNRLNGTDKNCKRCLIFRFGYQSYYNFKTITWNAMGTLKNKKTIKNKK